MAKPQRTDGESVVDGTPRDVPFGGKIPGGIQAASPPSPDGPTISVPQFNPSAGGSLDRFIGTVGGFLGGPTSAVLTGIQNAASQGGGSFQLGGAIDTSTGVVSILNPCRKGSGPNCIRVWDVNQVRDWESALSRFARTGTNPPTDPRLLTLVSSVQQAIYDRGRPLGYGRVVSVPSGARGDPDYLPPEPVNPDEPESPGDPYVQVPDPGVLFPGVPGGGIPLTRQLPVGFAFMTPAMQQAVLNAMRLNSRRVSAGSGGGSRRRKRRKSSAKRSKPRRKKASGGRKRTASRRKSSTAPKKGSAAMKRKMARLRAMRKK